MKINELSRIVALNCMLGAILCSPLARADEIADKLKQLEHAMAVPAQTQPENIAGERSPQHKTRNLMVRPATQAGEAANEAAHQENTGQAQTQAAKTINCGRIAADAKIRAVDFAIQFKVGSADLTKPAEETLEQIASVLSLSNNCVVVEGHTDSVGNANRNLELSRLRAESVVKFITEKAGISKSRFISVGKGYSEPVKNLDSRDPKNRRVVFKVVG